MSCVVRRYAGSSVHSFIKHIFGALMPPSGLEQQPGLSEPQRQLLQGLLAPRAPAMLRSLAAGAVGMLPTGALDQICGALFAILQVRWPVGKLPAAGHLRHGTRPADDAPVSGAKAAWPSCGAAAATFPTQGWLAASRHEQSL